MVVRNNTVDSKIVATKIVAATHGLIASAMGLVVIAFAIVST